MNYIDLFLAAVIGLSAWSGIIKGFILESVDLICWMGSLLITFWLYPLIGSWLAYYGSDSNIWIAPASFIILLIISRTALNYFTDWILKQLPASAQQSELNKYAGLIPGAFSGILYSALIAAIALFVPFSDKINNEAQSSVLANKLSVGYDKIQITLEPFFSNLNNSLTKVVIKPGSDKFVKLPYTVKNGKRRPDLESHMLVLINHERKKEGLKPLKADPEMAQVAIKHSNDMFSRGYFSHISPEGKTPFDRIDDAKVRFMAAGENLALAQSLKQAHEGLMNSPGHRANILHKSFGRVGIGILDGGVYGIMVTQNFRN